MNNKSPYISATLKGYARGEVYRFGIVFFDKNGVPGFVNWVGDIKFPEISQYKEYTTGSDCQHHLVDDGTYQTTIEGDAKMFSMGIKFTVDISSIKDQISGYSIVRVEREEKDKTRLGMGIASPVGRGNFITKTD